MTKIVEFLASNKDILNKYADEKIKSLTMPKELKDSIVYSLVNDGKKLRPLIFLAMLDYYKLDFKRYLDISLAIELIHTYSLLHDDLPAMDNDDYRWGKLTNHKVYGEDIAILAGDAMQALAYELIVDNHHISADIKVKLVKLLADYSGAKGMIAGQIFDVKQGNYDISADYLQKMHTLKTGKLIILPLLFAGNIAGKQTDLERLENFGSDLGIAYQIKDDILDNYGDFEKIGKKPSDEGMVTYLSFYGIEKCEDLLKTHTDRAINEAELLNNKLLIDFANMLLKREK
ncbi:MULTISPECIES: polyprenyl synthetase family protein [unclassified Gemella]|uniref:polyprenyl synthetase family protein n=1 Tax=unclassified Gemella TaxID=2624949 RepID=UPI001072F1A4|nr:MULTISPECIES: farnesyl diphosphate synthase [unclassified Gemella]MBF0710696.1 polyprenyl synthetase family protein [Gemella sp. GL1.1]MBF0746735.1 polyprenyl synthetase family protein [Gemella sp. 19428wG2_WT2a]NYS28040.1 polyprenyl synthetase family protein [Gemella sp. GL1]TFU60083.1 polyprenyl synthetase family protein [Gemella sp. WT2a]